MPRRPREEVEGAVHHVYARAVRRRKLFRDDIDRRAYLRLLAKVTRQQGWLCLGYCLMGNHMHLLIETPRANLGTGIQWLHGRYAEHFNRRHGTEGHVFQRRYDAVRMLSDAQLWVVARYIARNPVEAGLCREAAEWPWSSHASVLGGSSPPWLARERLLEFLSSAAGDPRERYVELVRYEP
jgi:putative transposase